MAKKQTIKINHIAKMEGHTGFVAHILDGNVIKAKMATIEGARLIEGVLINRDYYEAPIITGRICGVCPIVHFLSSIQAIESAFKIKVSEQTIILRKIMESLQNIHSHALHLFFLSLPDFFDIENDLNFIKKYPKEAEAAIRVRQFAIDMVKIIGGRTVMPLSMEVGGFKKLPAIEDLNKLMKNSNSLIADAIALTEFSRDIKYPKFERQTEFVALYDKSEYEILKGDIKVNSGKVYKVKDFYKQIKELHQRFDKVKRTHFKGEPYFVGALARININYELLNPQAKKLWKSSSIKLPTYNTFHNVLAQAVEIVHSLEEIKKLLKILGKIDQKNTKVKVVTRAGEGYGAVEAPRGLLIDYYKLDKNGKILDVNIITPTAQFLANLDADLKEYLPNVYKLPIAKRRRKIRTLVRAYDPCISCATH
jgi:sulfhydrogenase subunit alpha